jgi:hypothetical protein
MLGYAAVAYLAIGTWPAVLTWFKVPMHPAFKLAALALCALIWPLALRGRKRGGVAPPRD